MKELLIIIPAYNEEKNIGKVLDSLSEPDIKEIADVMVINDASKDRTKEIVEEHNIPVVTNIFNIGYGGGIQLGYKYAARNGYQYVIQMDADGQHDVSNVKNIYDELRKKDETGHNPDIVLGARFMKGSAPFKVGIAKKIAFVLFRGMIKMMTGRRISDPTTGLQGLGRRAFELYSQYDQFDDKYPDANMILRMIMLGYRVKEIPAVMHIRQSGVSMHSGLKPIVYMFRMFFCILSVWVRIRILKIDEHVD